MDKREPLRHILEKPSASDTFLENDEVEFFKYLYTKNGADLIKQKMTLQEVLNALFYPLLEKAEMHFNPSETLDPKTEKIGGLYLAFARSYTEDSAWEYCLILLLDKLGFTEKEIAEGLLARQFNQTQKARLNGAALRLNFDPIFKNTPSEEPGSLPS